MPFTFEKLSLPGPILVKPRLFGDERGFFLESYKESDYVANGIEGHFTQDNHSLSAKGVLRGLHYQLEPKPQGKLVRVVAGKIVDVAVDIRKSSPTFGQYVMVELSCVNHHQLWLPAGFAHGFLVLEDKSEVLYKTTGEYAPELERGIRYDDPTLAIAWPDVGLDFVVSEKDKKLPDLKRAEYNFK